MTISVFMDSGQVIRVYPADAAHVAAIVEKLKFGSPGWTDISGSKVQHHINRAKISHIEVST